MAHVANQGVPGLGDGAGREAARCAPGRAVEDVVVAEPERRKYLRQRGVVDHLLEVAGDPGRPGAGRRVAAGRGNGVVAGAQQQVGQLVGHVVGEVVVGQAGPGGLVRGAHVRAQVAEYGAVALLYVLDGRGDLRAVLIPEGVEGVGEPAA